ncbi:hypothetical protein SPI_03816 [Niveomyces insectorum RCEF 264]|uniref:Uncharacterized protein n=1 Tax=Niveomyces insectorum RCEF 264 TaxID=1081102 RepID=A0A167WDM7_9HYPO|nr:hypothetical protein SPI_03816 [Niveomyces insectorum RCEF 264]
MLAADEARIEQLVRDERELVGRRVFWQRQRQLNVVEVERSSSSYPVLDSFSSRIMLVTSAAITSARCSTKGSGHGLDRLSRGVGRCACPVQAEQYQQLPRASASARANVAFTKSTVRRSYGHSQSKGQPATASTTLDCCASDGPQMPQVSRDVALSPHHDGPRHGKIAARRRSNAAAVWKAGHAVSWYQRCR